MEQAGSNTAVKDATYVRRAILLGKVNLDRPFKKVQSNKEDFFFQRWNPKSEEYDETANYWKFNAGGLPIEELPGLTREDIPSNLSKFEGISYSDVKAAVDDTKKRDGFMLNGRDVLGEIDELKGMLRDVISLIKPKEEAVKADAETHSKNEDDGQAQTEESEPAPKKRGRPKKAV